MAAPMKSMRFQSPSSSPWMIDSVSLSEWFTKGDRLHVCRLLYSSDVAKQKRGLDRLAAWKARIHPRVPLGFEVTGSLLVALMTATDASLDVGEMRSVTDNETARLNLAMALVRFVNLVTETGQVMYFAMDVSSIATKMGVPEWIVDIRHNCSHSTLPSLGVLMSAARFALQWTKTHFWEADDPLDVNGTFVMNGSRTSVTRADLARRLANIQLLLLQRDQQKRNYRKVQLLDKDLEYLRKNETAELADILIEDGLLIPSRDKAFREFLTNTDDEDVQPTNGRKRLYNFWMPMLEDFFQRPDVFRSVVQALVIAATQQSEVHRARLAFEWTMAILERFLPANSASSRDDCHVGLQAIREALKVVARDVNWNLLRLLNRIQQMRAAREIQDKPEVPGTSHLFVDCGAWKFCSGKDWSNFAVGIDKDDEPASWFADKLQLKCYNNDVINVRSPRKLKRKIM